MTYLLMNTMGFRKTGGNEEKLARVVPQNYAHL
jgi:hypothetical protein